MNWVRSGAATVAAVVLTLSAVSGCSGGTPAASQAVQADGVSLSERTDGTLTFVDGPGFESVAALDDASDAVVRGTFVRLTGHASDADISGTGTSADGLPLDLWQFTVDEVLRGHVRDTIAVTQVGAGVEGGARTAEPGAQAVLFLRAYDDRTYAVTGLGVGSFAVAPDGTLAAAPEALPELRDEVAGIEGVADIAD